MNSIEQVILVVPEIIVIQVINNNVLITIITNQHVDQIISLGVMALVDVAVRVEIHIAVVHKVMPVLVVSSS
jgi:hypothetical protein